MSLKMMLSTVFKSKLNLSLIFASLLICILIFQNCGRIVISSKEDPQVGTTAATDIEAEDIIKTMTSAGIKDAKEFNETIDLTAEMMTCGTKLDSVKVECVFTNQKLKFTTSDAPATAVKNYLSNIGIARDCPTCNDTESYTVRNMSCVKDPKFPREAKCTFAK